MFYLSKGIIQHLFLKNTNLFGQASGSEHENVSCANVSVTRLNYLKEVCLVRVDEVVGSKNDSFFGLKINDGQDSEQVFVDLSDCKDNLEHIQKELSPNSVILVTEISFVQLRDALNTAGGVDHTSSGHEKELELEFDLNKRTMLIKSFILVGVDDDKHEDELSTSTQLTQKMKESKVNEESLLKIADLNCDCSKSEWAIKCVLKAKGLQQTFAHFQTLRPGVRMRIQLFDGVNSIEVVAFDDLIKKFNDLVVDKVYLIERGNILVDKANFRYWPLQTNNLGFAIQIRDDTTFTLIADLNHTDKKTSLRISPVQSLSKEEEEEEEEAAADVNRASASSSDSGAGFLTEISNSSRSSSSGSDEQKFSVAEIKRTSRDQVPLKIEKQPEVNEKKKNAVIDAGATRFEYHSLSEIKNNKQHDQTVSVIGILNKIFELKESNGQYGQPLSIINCELIDNKCETIRITFWGNEATQFTTQYKIGDCLIFKNIKTNLYLSRVTLSKTRDATCSNVSRCLTNPKVVELNNWYSEYKSQQNQKIFGTKRCNKSTKRY